MEVEVAITTSADPPRKERSALRRAFTGETLTAWLFILPSFVGFFFFTRCPLFAV